MRVPSRSLTPSQAAARLGVSAKALRLYEQQGLISPDRSAAGWRLYDPNVLDRASRIISLRALGLSLAQIGRVVDGDPSDLDSGLAAHEEGLRQQARRIAAMLQRVRSLRVGRGPAPATPEPSLALDRESGPGLGFELPWPWGGEWFELDDIRPLNFITGPLGSGKTRFAERLAAGLPDAKFLGLDRQAGGSTARRLAEDPALAERVERTLEWLEKDGAERNEALIALVAALEADRPAILVVDLVEDGLGDSSQRALIAHLRLRARRKRALFLMTRSSSILDLDLAGADEAIILCPANHGPPFRITPCPGGHGYEAAATCLATPEVRARTAGVIAVRAAASR